MIPCFSIPLLPFSSLQLGFPLYKRLLHACKASETIINNGNTKNKILIPAIDGPKGVHCVVRETA